ncbi:MAG: hypothetical protein K2L14_05345 [Duncaniella sp.]|nr:hypothetical protein [Duncaniella sp.]
MNLKRYVPIVLSVILAAYLVVTIFVTAHAGDDVRCTGMTVTVDDNSPHPFVTAGELMRELDSLPALASGMYLREINPQAVKRTLMAIDKIEDVSVETFTDGKIEIKVTPIIPVARVFDGDRSYYINRSGKRVTATARYHKDVPVIAGHFPETDTVFTPESLLPLIDFIAADSVWSRYVTMIEANSAGDIVLVPAIRDHVVLLGSADNLKDKFHRLRRFYTEVLSRRGYETYDTISLKWRGQIVATRRKKNLDPVRTFGQDDDEAVDTTVMLTAENVAPGRTLPGQKAHSEKPIPAKTSKQPNP